MKTLPEKWAIKRTRENASEINAWYKSLRERYTELERTCVYITNELDFYHKLPTLYTEITLDFWRECVLGPVEPARQPIAYKVLTNIFSGTGIGRILDNRMGNQWCSNLEPFNVITQDVIDKLGPEYFEPIYEEDKPKKEVLRCWVILAQEFNGKSFSISPNGYLEFPTEPEAQQWVIQHGEKGKYYLITPVVYIV